MIFDVFLYAFAALALANVAYQLTRRDFRRLMFSRRSLIALAVTLLLAVVVSLLATWIDRAWATWALIAVAAFLLGGCVTYVMAGRE